MNSRPSIQVPVAVVPYRLPLQVPIPPDRPGIPLRLCSPPCTAQTRKGRSTRPAPSLVIKSSAVLLPAAAPVQVANKGAGLLHVEVESQVCASTVEVHE